jgi:hypothetical protein
MLVKDLIKKLQQVDPELKVIIHHTDPSDWDYNLPLREQDVRVEIVDYFNIEDANFEDGEPIVPEEEVLIIDFSFE